MLSSATFFEKSNTKSIFSKKNNIDNIPVIVGGIIPVEDERILLQNGVKAVYTPKNYQMSDIMSDIVSIVEKEI